MVTNSESSGQQPDLNSTSVVATVSSVVVVLVLMSEFTVVVLLLSISVGKASLKIIVIR